MLYGGSKKQGTRLSSAFTLIEILVVIAIISILMTLAVAGAFKMIDVQKQANTEAAMRTVMKVIQQQWSQVISDAKAETDIPATVRLLAGNDPTGERARILWIKLRLMEAFPNSFAEINGSALYNVPSDVVGAAEPYIPIGRRHYLSSLQSAIKGIAAPPVKELESATCLLLVLQQSHGGVSLNADILGPAAQDTNGDNLKEVVDGWGRPMRFFRFPSSNDGEFQNKINPTPASNFGDPLDPKGLLANPAWVATTNLKAYQDLVGANVFVSGSPTKTLYTTPVLVSAGQNGLMGLDALMNPVGGTGEDYDNIYSYRLKLGSRGD